MWPSNLKAKDSLPTLTAQPPAKTTAPVPPRHRVPESIRKPLQKCNSVHNMSHHHVALQLAITQGRIAAVMQQRIELSLPTHSPK